MPLLVSVSAEASTVALSFITIHVWKRVYETQCVSVFSDAKINITHYMLGYLHYIGTLLCILGETEGFVSGKKAYTLCQTIIIKEKKKRST